MLTSFVSNKSQNHLAIFRPLGSRNFRLLLMGEFISLMGNQIHLIVLAWLALHLTGSGLALGSVLMATAIPKALFMLFGGALSDRFSLKRLMQVSNIARAAIAAGIAVLVFYQALTFWHLYLLALLIGVADGIFHPALMTTVPKLLEQNELEAGNALVRGVMKLSTFAASAPTGLLITAIGIAATFGIDAFYFLLAAVVLWFMPEVIPLKSTIVMATPKERRFTLSVALADIKNGMIFAWQRLPIRVLLLTIAVIHLSFLGPLIIGLASLANSNFAGGATDFGIVRSVYGGSALLGTVIAGLVVIRRRDIWLIAITVVLGGSLVLMGLVRDVVSASLLAGLMGIGNGLFNVLGFTWLQTTTTPHMLGRMMGLINASALILAPVSYLLTGVISDVSPSLAFIIAGIPVSAMAVYLALSRYFHQIQ